MATEVTRIAPSADGEGALLLAASWEDRCSGVAERLSQDYRAGSIVVTVYDGESERREKNIERLRALLSSKGDYREVAALHGDPVGNVRQTVELLSNRGCADHGISIDVTTFTRKHLLQLLQGLDRAGLLTRARFYYTQPLDYHTPDNEPITRGVTSVKAIRGFAGSNRPSRDSLLVLFLSYEGRRAETIWEHLEPNQCVLVLPDPPYIASWRGRAEEQNRYLLSRMPDVRVVRSHSADPADTERLLLELMADASLGSENLNYQIAPLGTKGQLIGIYRFWRRHPTVPTLMYASPTRYRDDRPQFPAARVLLMDDSRDW